jgi:hypothetical protein
MNGEKHKNEASTSNESKLLMDEKNEQENNKNKASDKTSFVYQT